MHYGSGMKGKWQCWMPFCGVVLWLGVAQADVTSPYQTFVERNPFGLQPVPAPPPAPVITSPPPAKVNIQLSGISALGGTKRAWLVIPPGQGRTNTTYLSFSEGDPEREGIRVQSIDPERGIVQILNAGAPATLDFENHGLAYSGPVAVANVAGRTQPGRPGARVAPPGTPVANPARPTIVTPGQTGARPGATGGSVTPTRTIPARNVRTSGQQNVPEVDPAVQAIRMRADELRMRSEGVEYPPMPPIPGMP
jgi:hypothetical protein